VNIEPWSPLAPPKAGKHRTFNVEHRMWIETVKSEIISKQGDHYGINRYDRSILECGAP
jgi:hypothetical protein